MHWVDLIHFPELVNELQTLDQRLDALAEACEASGDPDAFGLLDDMEQVIGLGFFRCQHYMVRRRDTSKGAYVHGPRFRSYPYAMVINAGANYWKHVDEWPDESELAPFQQSTLDILLDAGIAHRDYRVSNLLYALHPAQRLSRLIPHLVDWRVAFDRSVATTHVNG